MALQRRVDSFAPEDALSRLQLPPSATWCFNGSGDGGDGGAAARGAAWRRLLADVAVQFDEVVAVLDRADRDEDDEQRDDLIVEVEREVRVVSK